MNLDFKKITLKEVLAFSVFTFLFVNVIRNIFKSKDEKDVLKDIAMEKTKPTYTQTQYNEFANKIYSAGLGTIGTDEDAIYSVFNSLKNNMDFLQLVKAFGKRRLEFTLGFGTLSEFLRSELNNKEIQKINEILKTKKITYVV